MDINTLKEKMKMKKEQTKDFIKRNWKYILLVGGIIGPAIVVSYLSSKSSDEDENDVFVGNKPTNEELDEMSDLCDKLKDYDGSIFIDMFESFTSGRMTMNDIRKKARNSLSKVNYYNAPSCAKGCGGYPGSCMGCNLYDD